MSECLTSKSLLGWVSSLIWPRDRYTNTSPPDVSFLSNERLRIGHVVPLLSSIRLFRRHKSRNPSRPLNSLYLSQCPILRSGTSSKVSGDLYPWGPVSGDYPNHVGRVKNRMFSVFVKSVIRFSSARHFATGLSTKDVRHVCFVRNTVPTRAIHWGGHHYPTSLLPLSITPETRTVCRSQSRWRWPATF